LNTRKLQITLANEDKKNSKDKEPNMDSMMHNYSMTNENNVNFSKPGLNINNNSVAYETKNITQSKNINFIKEEEISFAKTNSILNDKMSANIKIEEDQINNGNFSVRDNLTISNKNFSHPKHRDSVDTSNAENFVKSKKEYNYALS